MTKQIDLKKDNLCRKLTTGAIFLECFTLGCAFSFFSPILVYLKDYYETDTESISKIFVVLTLSYLGGAMAGGLVYGRWIKRQHGVALSFMGISASLFIAPYCPTLHNLFITVGILGFFCGSYDTAQTVWIMEMWQTKSGPFIQAQHFSFALGSNLPSLLTAPFLPDKQPEEPLLLNIDHSSATKVPFTIVAGLAMAQTLFELFLIIFFPYKAPQRELAVPKGEEAADKQSESVRPQKPSKKHLYWRKVQLVTLSSLFLGFYQGMEMCSIQFIPTLANYGKLHLSEAESALVLTGLTGAFASGRAIGILIALKVSPQILISFNIVLVIVGNFILLFFGDCSTAMLWTACIVIGLGFSTMYGSFCAYMERHLIFTDLVGGIMLVAGASVGMVYPAIVGNFIERRPQVVTYTNFFSTGLCTLSFLIVLVITRKSNIRC